MRRQASAYRKRILREELNLTILDPVSRTENQVPVVHAIQSMVFCYGIIEQTHIDGCHLLKKQ